MWGGGRGAGRRGVWEDRRSATILPAFRPSELIFTNKRKLMCVFLCGKGRERMWAGGGGGEGGGERGAGSA